MAWTTWISGSHLRRAEASGMAGKRPARPSATTSLRRHRGRRRNEQDWTDPLFPCRRWGRHPPERTVPAHGKPGPRSADPQLGIDRAIAVAPFANEFRTILRPRQRRGAAHDIGAIARPIDRIAQGHQAPSRAADIPGCGGGSASIAQSHPRRRSGHVGPAASCDGAAMRRSQTPCAA